MKQSGIMQTLEITVHVSVHLDLNYEVSFSVKQEEGMEVSILDV